MTTGSKILCSAKLILHTLKSVAVCAQSAFNFSLFLDTFLNLSNSIDSSETLIILSIKLFSNLLS